MKFTYLSNGNWWKYILDGNLNTHLLIQKQCQSFVSHEQKRKVKVSDHSTENVSIKPYELFSKQDILLLFWSRLLSLWNFLKNK